MTSSASNQVTIWLTPLQPPAAAAVTRSLGGRDIYLLPTAWAGGTLPRLMTVGLLRPADNPVGGRFPCPLVPQHIFYPDPAGIGAQEPYLVHGVDLRADLPRSPWWSGAALQLPVSGSAESIGPTPPVDAPRDSPDDCLLIPRDGWQISALTPLPGEQILVTHSTHGLGSFTRSLYNSTRALTGGTVVAVRDHPDLAGAYVYDVDCENFIYTDLEPTDFTAYSVGDWIHLLRSTSDASSMAFPASVPESPESTELLRIAPLSIMGHP
jgi:hypothetical protein